MAIVDANGRPMGDEIASIKRDINRVFYGGIQYNEDDTLKARGGVKGLKIFQELKRDAHAGAVLAKRKLAVTSRTWDVLPASEARVDKKAAALVKQAFEALKFNALCKRLLEATLTGYAVAEVMWEVRDGLVLPRVVKARDPRRFIYTVDDELRLLTREQPLLGEPMPERKFIIHRRGADDDSPYGEGIGGMLFWPVFFKRQGITFWLTFADKFGSPTVLGKYPSGASKEEIKKLFAAMQAISQDAGIAVPEGMMMELMEATRGGGADTYEKLVRYCDEQISKAVLGETMSTTSAGAGLGSNQAGVHNDVRLEVAKDDGTELDETLDDSLIRWIVEYNLPTARLPHLRHDFTEPEDTKALAERDERLVRMGWEPSEEYVQETYGEGWTRKAPAALPLDPNADPNADPSVNVRTPAGQDPSADPGSDPTAQFADAGAPLGKVSAQRAFDQARREAIATAAEQLAAEWADVMRGPVEDITAELEASGDLVTFRERLTRLLDRKPDAATVEKLAQASFAAHVQGRGRAPAKPGLLARLKAAVKGN